MTPEKAIEMIKSNLLYCCMTDGLSVGIFIRGIQNGMIALGTSVLCDDSEAEKVAEGFELVGSIECNPLPEQTDENRGKVRFAWSTVLGADIASELFREIVLAWCKETE